MAAKHTIEFKNSADSKDKTLKKLFDGFSDTLSSAVAKAISNALESKGINIDEASLSKIVKAFASNQSKSGIIRDVMLPKNSSTDKQNSPKNTNKVSDSISNRIIQSLGSLAASIETSTGKTVDHSTLKDIKQAISKSVSNTLSSKGAGTGDSSALYVFKELRGLISEFKTAINTTTKSFESIKSMRKSGDKISAKSEGADFIDSMQSVIKSVDVMKSSATKTIALLKNSPSITKDTGSNLNEEIKTLRKNALERVRTAKKSIADSPVSFIKDFMKELNNFGIDTSGLDNIIKKMEATGEGMSDLISKLQSTISSSANGSNGIDFSGIEKFLTTIVKSNKLDSPSTGGAVQVKEIVSVLNDLKTLVKTTKDAVDTVKIAIAPSTTPTIKDKPVTALINELKKTANTANGLSSKGTSAFMDFTKPSSSTQAKVTTYREGPLNPAFTEAIDLSNTTKESEKHVVQNIKGLTQSLLDLQGFIVKTVDEELSKTNNGWKIVRKSANQNISEYFKLAQGYSKKTSGKEFNLSIANVKGLQKATKSKETDPTLLINAFKELEHSKLIQQESTNLPIDIAKWVKNFNETEIKNWRTLSDPLKSIVVGLKKSDNGDGAAPSKALIEEVGKLQPETLRDIFRGTISEIESTRKLTAEKKTKADADPLVQQVSIPSPRMSSVGTPIFETQQGSQRVLPKFATYKTGFENLYSKLVENNQFDAGKDYQGEMKKIGIRPTGSQLTPSNDLANNMFSDLSRGSEEARDVIVNAYRKASIIKAQKMTDLGSVKSPEEFKNRVNTEVFEKDGLLKGFKKGTVDLDTFSRKMEEVGVSAYDAAKSLESLEFKNIYDMFKQMLDNSGGGGPLREFAQNPGWAKNIREYEKHLKQLVGRVPIADPSRPRRYSHQEKVVNLMSMTSPVFDSGASKMTPEEQKGYIRDLNLNLKDFVKETKILVAQTGGTGLKGRNLPDDVNTITSLGIPESQAASIDEFRGGTGNRDLDYLSAFNATNIKMYTDDLTKLVPFGQFQQIGRNTAGTTNALANKPASGVGTDFPSLRTTKQNEMIASGRYGAKGYGYNVTTELRNTSSTFEDQIVISGKLADVLTSVTKNLVQPSKLGALKLLSEKGTVEAATSSSNISDLEKQTLVDVQKDLDKANRIFQDVLGIKQEYKGRAEKAEIKDIYSAITTVRGQDLNVQTAKLVETFFNSFGRKFTTSYGSKGVAVAPQGGEDLTGKQVSELFGNKRVKVLSKSERENTNLGLGTVALPKSMGKLLAEILESNKGNITMEGGALNDLKKELVKSGNKFMLSMFTDASLGVAPSNETVLQQELFNTIKKAVSNLNLDLGKDVSGINELKSFYMSGESEVKKSNKKLFTEKPIDMQLSSYGTGKRGLQTETLEAVMNNVINAGPSGATSILPELSEGTYKKMLTSTDDKKFPSLSEYSKALGFDRQSGSRTDIFDDMVKALKATGKYDGKENEIALNQKAEELTKLEYGSNFYSKIADPSGESRSGIVGSKFVSITEDPQANPAWSETDIKKQVKGERLNIPAYGAYSTIFGKDSNFMKEISSNISLESKKHWEYLKTLQTVSNKDTKAKLLSTAEVVDVKNLDSFEGSTGNLQTDLENTLLNTFKFPGAISLQIPDTSDSDKRESFYIPGGLARATYPEPNIPGERGMDLVSRSIQHIVNMAKEVDSIKSQPGGAEMGPIRGRIIKRLGNYRDEAERIAGTKKNPKQLSQQGESRLNEILQKLISVLSGYKVEPGLTYNNPNYGNRGDYIQKFFEKQVAAGNTTGVAYKTTIGQAVDQLIGPDPKNKEGSPYPERFEPGLSVISQKTTLGRESLADFSKQLGVEPPTDDEQLQKALKNLERAKINYYDTIKNSVLGKTGSVQEFLFTRKVPAVMAKAITATVDKSEDLSKFSKDLELISKQSGNLGVDLSSLGGASDQIDSIKKEHSETIRQLKSKGMPVLKQHELGVPLDYAKKLPVSYTKQYEVKDEKLKKLERPMEVSSNLAEMLQYKEKLQPFSEEDGVKSYMEKNLQPFIESVRFPFTGVSSVQPYEAKLLTPKPGERQLAKHSLTVPGVPEMDFEGFDEVKKEVEGKISELVGKLDDQYASASPNTEAIDELKSVIHQLSKALSDVIPEYIAHQQKLDFDGDQIEIHSAQTAAAREEIKEHYKSLTTFDPRKTTAQSFRKEFTYDANTPSTGKYVLAEQQMSFEKKFPKDEGFDFLKTPFLTENLEYLKPAQSLGILSNIPGAGGDAQGPLNALIDIIPKVIKNSEESNKLIEKLNSVVRPEDDKGNIDNTAYSKELLSTFGSINSAQSKSINKGVKDELFNTKYMNAVNAQLFKLNTGIDTEALNRLLKMFESKIGFGKSGTKSLSGAGYNFDPNMKKMFPTDLNTLGSSMGEELHTMMNELIRVAFQKGMDVKHAGSTPIAAGIVTSITKGSSGVTGLIDKIGSDDSYSDLKDFMDVNEKTLKENMSFLSTDEIMEDAKKIASGRGASIAELEGKDRDQLKDYIVKSIGFEGFLMGLGKQVSEAAYNGILAEIDKLGPMARKKRLQGKDPKQYAKEKIREEMSGDGINVVSHIEKSSFPLYGYRTSKASGYAQRGIYQRRNDGDPGVPELENLFDSSNKKDNPDKDVYRKYKEAISVARNLNTDLTDFVSSGKDRRSSYALLIESTVKNLKSDQKIINELSDIANKDKSILKTSTMSRVSGKVTPTSFGSKLLGMDSKKRKDFLEKQGRAVGVLSLGQESMAMLEEQFSEEAGLLARRDVSKPKIEQFRTSTSKEEDVTKAYEKALEVYEEDVNKVRDEYIKDAIDLTQSDIILKVAKTKSGERLLLDDMFSKKSGTSSDMFKEKRKAYAEQARATISSKTATSSAGTASGGVGIGGLGKASQGLFMPSGGIVPVHIASVANGIGVFLGDSSGMINTTNASSSEGFPVMNPVSDDLAKRIKRAEEIVEEITGGLNTAKDTTFEYKYRASGLKGGSGGRQVEDIASVMQGKGDMNDVLKSSSLMGQAIHEKLEDVYKRKTMLGSNVDTEVPIQYKSDEAGPITGTMDVIHRSSTDPNSISKVIDIKSIGEKHFNQLAKAIESFKESTGKEAPSIDEVKKFLPKDYLKNTKLDDVASQLNLYLAAIKQTTGSDAKAQADFYSAENTDFDNPLSLSFDFDKQRLQRDLDTISIARDKVKNEGGVFATTGSFETSKKIYSDRNKDIKEAMKRYDDGEVSFDDIKAMAFQKKNEEKKRLEELHSIAKEYYSAVKNKKQTYTGLASKGGVSDKEFENIRNASAKKRANFAAFDDTIKGQPVAEGAATYGVHDSLSELHRRARLFQQTTNKVDISEEGIKSFAKPVQTEIKKTAESGPKGAEFMTMLKELQETDEISQKEVNKAWLAYRVAVGDYYLKIINEAKQSMNDAPQGSTEQLNAFGDYQKRVKEFQERIKGDLGKQTDIYTYNNKYVAPESARGAGVMMDTDELIRKAAKPMGEDPKLKSIFKDITDLDMEELPLPKNTIRQMLVELTSMDTALIDIYTDAEKVAAMGPEINQAWDFNSLRKDLARLKTGLQEYLSFNLSDNSYTPEQKSYLQEVLKQIKTIEKANIDLDYGSDNFEPTDGSRRPPTLLSVSKQFSLSEQGALNVRNIELLKQDYKRPESEGGARVGEAASYNAKTFGPGGRVIDNQRFTIRKYSDEFSSTGEKIGKFDSKMSDLNSTLLSGNKGFATSIERVVKWGAAATIVYGGISYIKDAINQMAGVEEKMASLRMVMNPITTDFDALRKSAVGFAKEYGVGVEQVLSGMKIYAQQGLDQPEVVERTKTSTLASNVSTLEAKDATEALTSAMKVFGGETDNSIRYLDAWSAVESKAAVTAGDLADAIKKAAAAGKTAGFTFDQLNGIIASIGSVTRQTGKEVGTSLRFIFRRLAADAGPKALKNIAGISVISDTGELRAGYDVLDELAKKWKDLSQLEKLDISQAIGGTRQYNQVLVLMDNWKQAVSSVSDSLNSKGAAERKNLEIMKTYSKQLSQTKAHFTELKIEIGKLVLPSFKTSLAGIRTVVTAFNNIPSSLKLAGAGFTLFLGYVAKGASVLQSFMTMMSKTKLTFSGLASDLSKGFKLGAFEVAGKGDISKNSDLFGKKSLAADGQVSGIGDLDSSLGQLAFTAVSAGQAYNKFLGIVGKDSATMAKKTGAMVENIADKIQKISGLATTALVVSPFDIPGPVDEAIGAATWATSTLIEKPAGLVKDVGGIGEKVFGGLIDKFASENTGAVKSLAPLVGTITGLAVLYPQMQKAYKALTQSAEEYRQEQFAKIDADKAEIDSIGKLISEYMNLTDSISEAKKPVDVSRNKETVKAGTYKSPLLKQIEDFKDFKSIQSKIGKLDSGLISGFDEFGNTVLNTSNNLEEYFKNLEKTKRISVGKTQLGIVAKFTDELTKTDGIQEWKSQLKELAASFPLIGEMMADGISVGPKKALEVIGKELNTLLQAKSNQPFSKAFDSDINELLKAQDKVKGSMADSYKGLMKTIDNINISSIEGVNTLIGTKVMKDASDLIANFEERYQAPSLKGTISGRDVQASIALKKLSPSLSGYIEPSAVYTKEKLLDSNVLPRGGGDAGKVSAKTGDLAMINKEFANQYGIASDQAILDISKTGQGFLKFLDENTGLVVRKSFTNEQLDSMVETIFPVNEVIKRSEDEITKLNTFITGASAGIIGMSDKTLVSKQVDLGDKFFSDISSNTLLQTDKGYNPIKDTYGAQGYKKNYKEDFDKYLFEPMKSYKEKFSLLKGQEADSSTTTAQIGGMGKRLKGLQKILANNSMVFQFRTAIEDLMKTLEEGKRTTLGSIQIEKERQKVDKETAGMMAGTTKGISGIDLGVSNYSDLSPDQRSIVKDVNYRNNAQDILSLEVEKSGLLEQYSNIIKTGEDLKRIQKTGGELTSRIIDPERAKEFKRISQVTGGDKGAAEISLHVKDLKDPLMQIVANTSVMAKQKIDPTGKEEKFKSNIMFNFKNPLGAGKERSIVNDMEGLYKLRKKASDSGNIEYASQLDDTINNFVSRFAKTYGTQALITQSKKSGLGADDTFRASLPSRGIRSGGLTRDAIVTEIYNREQKDKKRRLDIQSTTGSSGLFGGVSVGKDTEIEKKIKEYSRIQGSSTKKPFLDSNELGKATMMAFAYSSVKSIGIEEDIAKLEKQIKDIEQKRSKRKVSGKSIIGEDKELQDLTIKKELKEKFSRKKYATNVLQGMSGVASTAIAAGGAVGSDNTGRLKLAAAAAGIYALQKSMKAFLGDKEKENMKEFGKKGLENIQKAISGEKDIEDIGKSTFFAAKDYLNKFVDNEKDRKKITGKSDKAAAKSLETKREELSNVKSQMDLQNKLKDLESEMKATGNNTVRTLEAVVAAVSAGTLYEYIMNKTDTSAKVVSGEKQAKLENDAFLDVLRSSPEVLDEMLTTQSQIKREENTRKEEGPTESKLLDVTANFWKNLANTDDVKEAFTKTIEDINKVITDKSIVLSFTREAEAFNKAIEEISIGLSNGLKEFDLTRKYNPQKSTGNVLTGFGGEAELPVSTRQMSEQQRFYSAGSSADKSLFTEYSKLLKEQEARMQTVNTFSIEQSRLENNIEFGDIKQVDTFKKSLTVLNVEFEKVKEEAKGTSETINLLGTSLRNAIQYSTAINQLNDSLRDVSVETAKQAITGLKGYFDSIDKLFGGSSVYAQQSVSPEEERKAALVGINLTDLQSNAKQKEKASLLSNLSTTYDPKARNDLVMQLESLDEKYNRLEAASGQKKENDLLRTQLQPFETFWANLEEFKNFGEGLSPDQKNGIGTLQNDLESALKRIADASFSGDVNAKSDSIQELKDIIMMANSGGYGTSDISSKLQKWQEDRATTGLGNNPLLAATIASKEYLKGIKTLLEQQFGTSTNKEEEAINSYLTDKESRMNSSKNEFLHEDIKLGRKKLPIYKDDNLTDKERRLQNTSLGHQQALPFLKEGASKYTTTTPFKDGSYDKADTALSSNTKAIEDNTYAISGNKKSDIIQKASGGRIFGEGGPREDKVPAYLSPGEFVIRASAAQKIGYDALGSMNKQGAVPKLADGGTLEILRDKVKSLANYASDKLSFGTDKKLEKKLKDGEVRNIFKSRSREALENLEKDNIPKLADGGTTAIRSFVGNSNGVSQVTEKEFDKHMEKYYGMAMMAISRDNLIAGDHIGTSVLWGEETAGEVQDKVRVSAIQDAESRKERTEKKNNLFKEKLQTTVAAYTDLNKLDPNNLSRLNAEIFNLTEDSRRNLNIISKDGVSFGKSRLTERSTFNKESLKDYTDKVKGTERKNIKTETFFTDILSGKDKRFASITDFTEGFLSVGHTRQGPKLGKVEAELHKRGVTITEALRKMGSDGNEELKERFHNSLSKIKTAMTITNDGGNIFNDQGLYEETFNPATLIHPKEIGGKDFKAFPGKARKSALSEIEQVFGLAKEILGNSHLKKSFINKNALTTKQIASLVGLRKEEGSSKYMDRTTSYEDYLELYGPKTNYVTDGGSMRVYHNGGFVNKTGPIFAQKGELIVPKRFSDGGVVSSPVRETGIDNRLIENSIIRVDGSELLIKLEALELKIEDKELKVEEVELKVEEVELKVEDKELKVEAIELKIEDKLLKVEDKVLVIDASGIDSALKSTISTAFDGLPPLKIEDKKIEINTTSIEIDSSSASKALSLAIATAISDATVNIKVENSETGGSVGSAKLDKLSEVVSNVNDKLIAATTSFDDKITVIEAAVDGNAATFSSMDQKISIEVDSKLNTKLVNIQDNINQIATSVESLNNNVTSQISRVTNEVEDAKYRANNALNARNLV